MLYTLMQKICRCKRRRDSSQISQLAMRSQKGGRAVGYVTLLGDVAVGYPNAGVTAGETATSPLVAEDLWRSRQAPNRP